MRATKGTTGSIGPTLSTGNRRRISDIRYSIWIYLMSDYMHLADVNIRY